MPRISAFARLANGSVAPARIIEGQATRLSRTMHGIVYDAVHDEIIVPVALAGAVLVFRGGAQGEEPPIRVIQGPHTRISNPDTVTQDLAHDEIIVGDPGARSIEVFAREANGDVAPLRVIQGPATHLANVFGVAVDPIRNLLVASNWSPDGGPTGLLIFNRTDAGDVAPRGIIAGPRTGIVRIRQAEIDPDQGRIFVAVKNNEESYNYDSPEPSPWNPQKPGFIGVWNVTDHGDVPPRAVIKGPASGLVWPAGVALNFADREIYTIDSVKNALSIFWAPEFFERKMGR